MHSLLLFAHVQAYPDVPWAFIYRDPLHVMVSNLREKHSDKAPGPYCTGLKKQKNQSEYIQEIVASAGKSIEDLTREEYCAAYLVSLLRPPNVDESLSKVLDSCDCHLLPCFHE